MSLFAKLFNKNTGEVSSKNVEDFVSLTRVYFQSVIAANLGITNIRFVPDVANFKRLFKIPTQGGRLGQAEKAASRKMLMQDYGISENFFKEIDTSVKKHCRTQNDVQGYLFMYQGFSNDLMMLMGNLMQWKFRMPSIFKGALRSMTEKTVHDVLSLIHILSYKKIFIRQNQASTASHPLFSCSVWATADCVPLAESAH